jgi:hypothetical protein
LIWPLVVRYFSVAQIKRIAMFVILASPLLRLFLMGHDFNIYSNFFCRLDGLMAGALLVVALRTKTFEPPRYVKLAWASFLIAACLAILCRKSPWHRFHSCMLRYLARRSGFNRPMYFWRSRS